jgi:hypothetical protein
VAIESTVPDERSQRVASSSTGTGIGLMQPRNRVLATKFSAPNRRESIAGFSTRPSDQIAVLRYHQTECAD